MYQSLKTLTRLILRIEGDYYSDPALYFELTYVT